MVSWQLILMSDLVKVDVNEDGDVIRELWFVAAENEAGRRFRHIAMGTQAEAEERLALLVIDGGVDPVRSNGWDETYPVYGSVEYQIQEPEIVRAEKKECLEREADERARLRALGFKLNRFGEVIG